MRVVRNIVNNNRTIVCTIHQPSAEIFLNFDELLLLKRGGSTIYYGPLGEESVTLVDYFESIEGSKKLQRGYNPATFMLEARETPVTCMNELCVRCLHAPAVCTIRRWHPAKGGGAMQRLHELCGCWLRAFAA